MDLGLTSRSKGASRADGSASAPAPGAAATPVWRAAAFGFQKQACKDGDETAFVLALLPLVGHEGRRAARLLQVASSWGVRTRGGGSLPAHWTQAALAREAGASEGTGSVSVMGQTMPPNLCIEVPLLGMGLSSGTRSLQTSSS